LRRTRGERQGEAAVTAGPVGTVDGMFPPPFTLPDLDGNQVSLSDFEGKVVVLDLWATWCPPCREEIPFLVSLYEEFRDRGLVVVGVGLDDGGAPVLKSFAEENGMTYPVVVGNRSVQASYGVTAIPTTFMIGRDGRIATKHVGFHPSIAGEMRSDVESLLGVDGGEA
jgi:peroxiredoxin